MVREAKAVGKKFKSTARKGGKFLARMTKDVGKAGKVAGKGIYKGAKKGADVLGTWADNTIKEENRTGWGVGSPVRKVQKIRRPVKRVKPTPKKRHVVNSATKITQQKLFNGKQYKLAGTYWKLENAQERVSELKLKGYSVRVMRLGDIRYAVYVRSPIRRHIHTSQKDAYIQNSDGTYAYAETRHVKIKTRKHAKKRPKRSGWFYD
jgi:hypothetical protein